MSVNGRPHAIPVGCALIVAAALGTFVLAAIEAVKLSGDAVEAMGGAFSSVLPKPHTPGPQNRATPTLQNRL